MKKVLVVVDMQNDFVFGALKNEMAEAIIPNVKEKIEKAREEGTQVIFTADTHEKEYLDTEEGKNLPVEHCIRETDGWALVPGIEANTDEFLIEKPTFGSVALGKWLKEINPDTVELVGICTDICVISNALLAKAFLPNAHVIVDAACCAGVTEESHDTAIAAMEACHVEVNHAGAEPWRKDE